MKIKVSHIIAISVIAAFGVLVFLFVNAFTGNPVSAFIASGRIKAYAAKTYPTLDLTLSEVGYNFKNNAYGCHVQAKSSEDTSFYISYSGGKVSDDYPYEVANHFTTYRRLNEDFNQLVEDIILKEYPHETTLILGDLVGDTALLTPDKPLNLDEMPLKLSLVVWILSDIRDEEQMATLLLELYQLMLSKDIAIDQYTLQLEEPLPEDAKPGSGDDLYLEDFPAQSITDNVGELAILIKNHQHTIELNDKK